MAASHSLHLWMADPLLARPAAHRKRLFGCDAIYEDGRLLLVLASAAQPWNGLLFPVEHAIQSEVRADHPFLSPHLVLAKWLYLSVEDPRFEERGQALIQGIVEGDTRFGVVPQPKRKKKRAAPKPRQPLPDGRPPHLA